MTAEIALQVAMAAAYVFKQTGTDMNRVLIGKDTRLSGYMIEQAMSAGFTAMGMNVMQTGPIPTPAVSRLARTFRADLGVMISASHNAYQDNGIKLFGADGFKLSDEIESKIEDAIDADISASLASPENLGKASRIEDAAGRYIESVKRSFPRGDDLRGLKIVVDCAHGAAYRVAPKLLWELEADIIKIGIEPDGKNINDGCGATDTALSCVAACAF